MRFSTAIEFIRRGYFVADEAMKINGYAIGLKEIKGLDHAILVLEDKTGMELFNLEPEITFDDTKEWEVAIRINNTFEYLKFNDDDIDKKFEKWEKIIEDYCCSSTEKKSEENDIENKAKEKLAKLQNDFLEKTAELVFEIDMSKKYKLYDELMEITKKINTIKKKKENK